MRILKPEDTNRKPAFELWQDSPMPMVTLIKEFDLTNLIKISKRYHLKLNMLLMYCIGKAASQVKEFYTIPYKDHFKSFNNLAVNVIVKTKDGKLSSCDILYTQSLHSFNQNYLKLTQEAYENGNSFEIEDATVIGTSAIIQTELIGCVNQYSEKFPNPFLSWGKINKNAKKVKLNISFQFHHVQMDGGEAGTFLEILQKEIKEFRI